MRNRKHIQIIFIVISILVVISMIGSVFAFSF